MLKTLQRSARSVGKRIYKIPERQIEGLTKHNYGLARSYYHKQLERADRRFNKAPVLIYQMGKVGSSSVTHSLRNVKLGRRIYHVHFLRQDYIEKYEAQRKDWLGTNREPALKHIWQYQYLREKLDKGLSDKWKIITLIRDPVARNLSTFFQNMEVVSSKADEYTFMSPEHQFEVTITKDKIEPLIDLFFDKIDHEYPLIFFEREFNHLFDIDVMTGEFSTEQGYEIYSGDQAELLFIRLEDLNDCVSEAFETFLDLQNFTLQNTNVGSEKAYADVYKQFKNIIVLPKSYLDSLYDTPFMHHFYSEPEIDAFRKKWTR